jgi:hypothetical protein
MTAFWICVAFGWGVVVGLLVPKMRRKAKPVVVQDLIESVHAAKAEEPPVPTKKPALMPMSKRREPWRKVKARYEAQHRAKRERIEAENRANSGEGE